MIAFPAFYLLPASCPFAQPKDALVQRYFGFPLKESEKNGAPVTLKTLANHTSGLPRLTEDLLKMALSNLQNPYKDYT